MAGIAEHNGVNGTGPVPGGNGLSPERIAAILTDRPMTTGYVPTPAFMDQFWSQEGVPYWWIRRDIPAMLAHPHVRNSLSYYKAGLAGAEFWGGSDPENPDNSKGLEISDDPRVSAFALEQCQRFWDRGVHPLQRGYDYGWVGAENEFIEEDGQLRWDGLKQFAPRDTFILTQGHIPVGIRVRNVINRGQVDLWFASGDVPAKGLWYAHDPIDGMLYGQSQLFGAWRPWRRLGYKDAAESVVDMGFYRHFFAGPVIKYPEEDYQSQPGIPCTTLDSQGRPRRYARDMARMMVEQYKAGAGIGLPSGNYPTEMGGGEKWQLILPTSVLNVAPGIDYLKKLEDSISYGIGVPPELLEASETGSGYSGRAIPMEAFLDGQQRIADTFLTLFINQVLKPLVKWNFGDVRFTVKVRRLLETKTKAASAAKPPGEQQGGMPGQPGQQPGQVPSNNPASPAKPAVHHAGMFSLATDRSREIARNILRLRAA